MGQREKVVRAGDQWIRRYHPSPSARATLVCLPYAGGSASYFFPVSRELAPNVEVLAIQYPGRQDRLLDPMVSTVEELADAVTEVLLATVPGDRPLALFGHSMGATTAFEVAARLERHGAGPAVLFVSGRRAPSVHRDERSHLLDDAGLWAEVVALGGAAGEVTVDPELVRMALPAIRNDFTAIETYRYRHGPRLRCPIHAIVGDADPKAPVEEVRAWADHTEAGFALDVLPGGHFYLDQHLQTVLYGITEALPGEGQNRIPCTTDGAAANPQ